MQSILAVASFHISSAQFFKLAWCSDFSELSDSRVKVRVYCSLFETVL